MKLNLPPDNPPDLPEWARKPIYPSSLFGGTRGEVWTPEETGVLFLGYAILSDAVTTLRSLLGVPTDAEDCHRADAIEDAAEWAATAGWWLDTQAAGEAKPDTDRGEALMEITMNVGFLLESVQEHISRLGHG